MKLAFRRLAVGVMAGLCLAAGAAWGACLGDDEVAGEWIFEPVAEMSGWALNSGGDGDMGNLGLTGGVDWLLPDLWRDDEEPPGDECPNENEYY